MHSLKPASSHEACLPSFLLSLRGTCQGPSSSCLPEFVPQHRKCLGLCQTTKNSLMESRLYLSGVLPLASRFPRFSSSQNVGGLQLSAEAAGGHERPCIAPHIALHIRPIFTIFISDCRSALPPSTPSYPSHRSHPTSPLQLSLFLCLYRRHDDPNSVHSQSDTQ